MSKVEFVEYTGRYPNRCSGRLFVKIDGKLVSFGNYCLGEKGKTNDKRVPNYPAFWRTGGSIYYENDWDDDEIEEAPWELDVQYVIGKYSDDIVRLLPELIRIFNENVPWGCCGGCV